jgi:hypothetical protein
LCQFEFYASITMKGWEDENEKNEEDEEEEKDEK